MLVRFLFQLYCYWNKPSMYCFQNMGRNVCRFVLSDIYFTKSVGKWIYLWLFGSICTQIFVTFFTRPVLFNSTLGAWFYVPLIEDFATVR